MKCRNCGHECRDTAKFCDACGQPLQKQGTSHTIGDLAALSEKKNRNAWYFLNDSITAGPYDEEQMAGFLEDGTITARTLVARAADPDWKPLYESGLKHLLESESEPLWFYAKDQEIRGPFSIGELRRHKEALEGDTPVLSTEMDSWQPLKKTALKELLEEEPASQPTEEIRIPAPAAWYYSVSGEPQGPESEEQMRRLVQDGILEAGSEVWKEGMEAWVRLDQSPFASFLKKEQPQEEAWYYATDGQSHGPFSEKQLVRKMQAGTLRESDYVLRQGMKKWVKAGESRFRQYLKEPAEWYASSSGETYGPYTRRQMLDYASRGLIGERTYVWKNGMSDWKLYDPALFSALPAREQWFYSDAGKSYGPYSSGDLRELFQNGLIQESTYVWNEAFPDWIHFGQTELCPMRRQLTEWFYSRKGKTYGPYDELAMKKMYYQKEINDNTYVWKEGMPDWTIYSQSQLGY